MIASAHFQKKMRPKKNIGSTGIFQIQWLFPMIICFESGKEMEEIFEVMSFTKDFEVIFFTKRSNFCFVPNQRRKAIIKDRGSNKFQNLNVAVLCTEINSTELET